MRVRPAGRGRRGGPGRAARGGSPGAGPRWLLPGPAEVMAARGGAGPAALIRPRRPRWGRR